MRWIAVAKLLRSRMFVLAAAVLWVPGTAGSAAAEWFLDLYSGAAFTNAEDVEARWTVLGGTIEGLFKEVDFDTSVVFGGRVGYRFVGLPFFAVALDVWHFRPDVGAQTVRATNVRLNGVPSGVTFDVSLRRVDVQATGISFGPMFRVPLAKLIEPLGSVEYYVTAGPTLFIGHVDGTWTTFDPSTGTLQFRDDSDTVTQIGVQAGAGFTWLFRRNVGVFAEYRFSHFAPEIRVGDWRFETNVNTHSVLGGLTLRF